MSLHVSGSVSERDTAGSNELGKTVEPTMEELSDSALLDSDGEGGGGGEVGGWEELQLDYEEELMEDTDKLPRRVCQEDEVKLHAAWEIVESSGEEGEIKDESGSSSPHSQHQHTSQTTSTVEIDNSESSPSAAESEPENANKEEGEGEGEDEEAEGRQEVSYQEKAPSGVKPVEVGSGDSGIPQREIKLGPVCRHFLQGKCSWGKDCRFSHDDHRGPLHLHPPAYQPKFPTPHFHGPQALPDRFIPREDPFLHPPEPDFMRMLPGPMPPHLPSLREGIAGASYYMPYDQREPGSGQGGGLSQVAEESEGWYRLRTVANHWSSDDEAGTPRGVQDLREKLKSSKTAESSDQPPVRLSPAPEPHEEHRYKGKKKVHKTEKEVRFSSSSAEDDPELEVGRKKQRSKGCGRDGCGSVVSSESEEAVGKKTSSKRRKRKRHSSSPSSGEDVGRAHLHDGYMYHSPHRLPGPSHIHLHLPPHRRPPGPPDERFISHGPPDSLMPTFGPTHPPHRHLPMDPYGPPVLPPHGPYSDHMQYGPLPYREWHRRFRSPPHPPRGRCSIPRSPSPKRERHRHRKHNVHSQSSESSPEPSHHHRKKSSEHRSKTQNRKEKLLQELSVINKVIERKKQKKHGRTASTSTNKHSHV